MQAKSFLQHFHQTHITASAKQIESEQWSPADVPASVQAIVQNVLESAVKNPPAFELAKSGDLNSVSGPRSNQTASPSKMLSIEDKSYYAVSASLRSLEALEEYLKIVINLPLLTTDTMGKIVEFLKVSGPPG